MLANIGPLEILAIILLLVLVFGATQIPKIARAIGEGLKELKKGIREAKELDEGEPAKQAKSAKPAKSAKRARKKRAG